LSSSSNLESYAVGAAALEIADNMANSLLLEKFGGEFTEDQEMCVFFSLNTFIIY